MTAASSSRMSYEDYLVLESSSETKHEWCDGVVYAMSRGSPEHGRLTARVIHALKQKLGPECEVYASDTMLWIERAKLSTYADASVVCGALETKKVTKNRRSLGEAVTNPTIIVEVLSEGTERYDRDAKFQAYKQIPSLEEYVLVSQDDRIIEVYRRSDGWSCEKSDKGGSVHVHGAVIAADDVYGEA